MRQSREASIREAESRPHWGRMAGTMATPDYFSFLPNLGNKYGATIAS